MRRAHRTFQRRVGKLNSLRVATCQIWLAKRRPRIPEPAEWVNRNAQHSLGDNVGNGVRWAVGGDYSAAHSGRAR